MFCRPSEIQEKKKDWIHDSLNFVSWPIPHETIGKPRTTPCDLPSPISWPRQLCQVSPSFQLSFANHQKSRRWSIKNRKCSNPLPFFEPNHFLQKLPVWKWYRKYFFNISIDHYFLLISILQYFDWSLLFTYFTFYLFYFFYFSIVYKVNVDSIHNDEQTKTKKQTLVIVM
jgi:hypothetical protein